ncbi:hypothetical protein [Fundicoccus culcitae]|uniref:Uncharacterized protein n=1 Tax=Fundicoccus culcitae TaxID=2969821 RepID=A0ABY5P3J8_9LACT|nr:hypothetical protein [Fundicoccus culcitae]UUX33302.1 hypothetical protein NRE15_10365 [Fundicoccus culcitae]
MSAEIDVRLFDIYTLSLQFAGRHFRGKSAKPTCRMSAEIVVRLFRIFALLPHLAGRHFRGKAGK